jgi:uncharacterized membrane protein
MNYAKPFSLEHAIGFVLRGGMSLASAALAAGLALSFVSSAREPARALLAIGISVLLLTPIARVLVSFADFISRRDWLFVVLTGIVLCLLASAFVAAFSA